MNMIKILKRVKDSKSNEIYKHGQTVDLGNERNISAVERGLAEWVTEPKVAEKKETTSKPITKKSEKK